MEKAVETSFQQFISTVKDSQQKEIAEKAACHALQTCRQWNQRLHQSIIRWIQFLILKMKSELATVKTGKHFNYDEYIENTEKAVIKGMQNVEKLYMVPDYVRKKDQQGRGRKKSGSKYRSSSQYSSTKNWAFSPQKTWAMACKKQKNFFSTGNFQTKTSVQHYFYRPQQHITKKKTTVRFDNKRDQDQDEIKERNSGRRVESYLANKKEQEDSLCQSQIKTKLWQLQSTFNSKLSRIESMIEQKGLNSQGSEIISRQQEEKLDQERTLFKHKQKVLEEYYLKAKKLGAKITGEVLKIFGGVYGQQCMRLGVEAKEQLVTDYCPNDQTKITLKEHLARLSSLLEKTSDAQKQKKFQKYVRKYLECVYGFIMLQKYNDSEDLNEKIREAIKKLE